MYKVAKFVSIFLPFICNLLIHLMCRMQMHMTSQQNWDVGVMMSKNYMTHAFTACQNAGQ